MGNSPNTDPSQAGKTDQRTAANNVPKSGKRPDQGAAPVLNPRADSNKDDADKRVMTAPDTLRAKHAPPILAQPPDELLHLKLSRAAGGATGGLAVLKSGSLCEDGLVRSTRALLKRN